LWQHWRLLLQITMSVSTAFRGRNRTRAATAAVDHGPCADGEAKAEVPEAAAEEDESAAQDDVGVDHPGQRCRRHPDVLTDEGTATLTIVTPPLSISWARYTINRMTLCLRRQTNGLPLWCSRVVRVLVERSFGRRAQEVAGE
jgi:hypothetical protein